MIEEKPSYDDGHAFHTHVINFVLVHGPLFYIIYIPRQSLFGTYDNDKHYLLIKLGSRGLRKPEKKRT